MAGDFRKRDAGKDPQRRPDSGKLQFLRRYSRQTALADKHMENAGSISIHPLAESGFPKDRSAGFMSVSSVFGAVQAV